MPFSLQYTSLAEQPARQVLTDVEQASKKRLGDLKLIDLVTDEGRPLLRGMYLFFDRDGSCLYAGKNGAQKFVERIPWHFCPSPDAWMNHFLRYTWKNKLGHDSDPKEAAQLVSAASSAEDDQLLLIEADDRDVITRLEKFFRIFAAPQYNAYSENYRNHYDDWDLSKPLRQVLEQL